MDLPSLYNFSLLQTSYYCVQTGGYNHSVKIRFKSDEYQSKARDVSTSGNPPNKSNRVEGKSVANVP